MDDKKFVQKELFDDFVSEGKKASLKGFFGKKPKFSINLCLEHITFVFIGFIVLSAIVFSIGVEKGKSLSPLGAVDTQLLPSSGGKVQFEENAVSGEPVPPRLKIREDASALSGPAVPEDVFLFTVQIASYAREDTAVKQVGILKARGNEAFVLKKGDYYIVCVGRFKNKQDADARVKTMRKVYADCISRKI
ncbi:MAG: SPOR domain-containing protein [Candidatus Omnitrophica bacterium]|nr:SPOR domain-containing protein [Candidatus Omnitrophota bacterium]